MALTIVLQRKGRVMDAMSDQLSALRRRASPQDQQLLDQLASVRTQLASLQFGSVGDKLTSGARRERAAGLTAEETRLENEIGRHSIEFLTQSQPITVEAVQAKIPAGTVLVEFAVYRPVQAKAVKGAGAHYVAYVLSPQGEPRHVELGKAATIDEAVGKFRQALRNPQRGDVKRCARKLDELVTRPVRKLLGDARHILVSPDGALNLIPFAALADERGEYLIKRYAITYLTSGRDLLRLQIARNSKSIPLVVADPVFGEVIRKKQVVTQAATTGRPRKQTINNINDLDAVLRSFTLVTGAAEEATRLKQVLPEAAVLTQQEATETLLTAVSKCARPKNDRIP